MTIRGVVSAMIEISQHSKEIALALLGEENKRLSSAYELRYGNKGSLSVDLNKGTWFDHEAERRWHDQFY